MTTFNADTISAAKAASKTAIEAQMQRWGFDPAHTGLWDHLVNNANQSLNIDMAQLTGKTDTLKRPIVAPQDDLSLLTPPLAQRLGAAYQTSYPNEQRVETALKPLMEGSGFPTAYQMLDAMHRALSRISARAALEVLDKQQTVERV